MVHQELREKIIRQRGSCCEWCGRLVLSTKLELHHCIVHRMKGWPELDCAENLMLVCHICHQSGEVNSWTARRWFWHTQQKRGYDMQGWLDGLGLKIKPGFRDELG